MDRYVEATPRGRWILFIYILLQIVIFILVKTVDENIKNTAINPNLELQLINDRAFLATLYATWWYLSFHLILVFILMCAIKSKQWPPNNMGVPVKTKITVYKKTTWLWAFVIFMFFSQSYNIISRWQRYFLITETNKEMQQLLKEHIK